MKNMPVKSENYVTDKFPLKFPILFREPESEPEQKADPNPQKNGKSR